MKLLTSGNFFAALATFVMIISVGAGLFIIGSPSDERMRHMDNRRVEDLRKISNDVDLFKTRHRRLPAALEELSREPGATANFRDPRTAQSYEYRLLNAGTYELCATFERDSVIEAYGGVSFWAHKAGRQCFQLEARSLSR